MALTTQTLAKASDALATQRAQLVRAYVDAARTMYGSLRPGDWWNDAVIVAVAGRLGLLEMSMLRRLSRLSVSYADVLLKAMGVTPGGTLPGLVYPRANTTPMDVAMRPAMLFRHLQAQRPDVKPKDWPTKDSEVGQVVSGWLDDIYAMLESEATTDATAASNRATVDRFAGSGVDTYRRIVHPELSATGTCGLCIAAADRYYSTADLLPLHYRCKCTVAPVLGGKDGDPGLNLTTQDLKRIYDEAGGTKRSDLSNIRVKTITHGELGPILDRNDTKTDGTQTSWEIPTSTMTDAQLTRMHDHAMEFVKQYRNLFDADKDWIDFRYDGKSYTFRKPRDTSGPYGKQLMGRLKQAQRWNAAVAEQLNAVMYQRLAAGHNA